MIWIKMATILVAALCMLLAAVRHREWRGGLLLLSCVFLAAAMNEPEDFFRRFFPLKEPELPAVVFFLVLGFVLAGLNRGTTLLAFKAVYANRRFPLLVWGLCLVSFLPQLGTDKHIWTALLPSVYSTAATRELVEHGIEFFGYLFLLNWAFLFLKDKWRILTRHVPSAHEHLLKEKAWELVGSGSRRNCYKLGDSGFCVKFYKAPKDCEEGKIKRSIRREIALRRLNKFQNSCSREVHLCNSLRHSLPAQVLQALPEVCERIYHPALGWGILETYCTNPDGSAIIPYEFEIKRQQVEANKTEIYRQAREMLQILVDISATFYEPGNLHPQFLPDGSITMRIVDFEVESKMLIPLEAVWPWYRRHKLRRKAERYLSYIRETYGIQEGGQG